MFVTLKVLRSCVFYDAKRVLFAIAKFVALIWIRSSVIRAGLTFAIIDSTRDYKYISYVCTERWSTQSILRTLTCRQFEQFVSFDHFVPLTVFQVSKEISRSN